MFNIQNDTSHDVVMYDVLEGVLQYEVKAVTMKANALLLKISTLS